MDWISTETLMPNNDIYVLAFHKKRGICLGYRWKEFRTKPLSCLDEEERKLGYCWDLVETKKNAGGEGIDWWEQPYVADDKDISHWMPLPKAPG